MRVFYFLILICFSACVTTVQIPLIEPPEISLPPGDQKIVFVSRFDTTQITFSKTKITEVYQQSYLSFIKGLEEGFKTIKRVSLQVSDTIVEGSWFTEDTPNFDDATHIPSLISKYQPDYLLTLDAFLLMRERDEEVVDYGSGGMAKITHYYLVGSAALAFFNRNAEVVDKMLMQDEAYIQNDISYGLSTHLGKYGNLAVPLCYELGFEYALMFDEYKYTEDRYMHDGKIFQEVVQLAKTGKWTDAKQTLLPITKSPKLKYAKQAAANMGVIEEALGNPSNALIWYTKAQSYMINNLYPE